MKYNNHVSNQQPNYLLLLQDYNVGQGISLYISELGLVLYAEIIDLGDLQCWLKQITRHCSCPANNTPDVLVKFQS